MNLKSESSKKILFVSPIGQLYGGGEKSGLEFCTFLIENGYIVETALPFTDNETYIEELGKRGMVYHLAPYKFDGINDSFSLGPKTVEETFGLVDIINTQKPDLIISNISAFTHGALAAAFTGVPHIWMERGNGYRIDEPNVRKMLDFVFEYSNAVITNSSGLSDVYRATYKNTPTAVVRSFTDTPKVGLNSQIKKTRIIAVSRLAVEKNLIELLQALQALKLQYPDLSVKTIIMGHDNGSKAQLSEYIDKDNWLSETVEIIDFSPTPWQYFGPNDIYVNTSLYESIGRSTIEALRLGLPVVLADIPGHKDVFDLAGGYKYEQGNSKDLAAKLYRILSDRDAVNEEVAVWQKKVQKNFNQYSCNKDSLPLIKSVLDQRNPKTAYGFMKEFIKSVNRTQVGYEGSLAKIKSLEESLSHLASPGIKTSIGHTKRAVQRKLKKFLK